MIKELEIKTEENEKLRRCRERMEGEIEELKGEVEFLEKKSKLAEKPGSGNTIELYELGNHECR